MTANITQQVTIRRRSFTASSGWSAYPALRQRGSLTQQTATIGFGVTVLVSLSLLGFFYLQQVLNTASRGDSIHSLENELHELKSKQKALELQSAELRSMQSIEENVKKLNLIPTDRVSYVGSFPEKRVAVVERSINP